MWVDDAWALTISEKNASLPFKTRTVYAVPDPLLPRTHSHKHQGMNGFRDWENLRNARPVQAQQVRALHEQASVPEGPCSLEELRRVLSPHYQLLVMCRTKHLFLVFKDPDAPHQIRLLKPNDYYDGCTSFPAFVNRSYWCVNCEKGFNTNDATNHPCPGKTIRREDGLIVQTISHAQDQRCGLNVAMVTFTDPLVLFIMPPANCVTNGKRVLIVRPGRESSRVNPTVAVSLDVHVVMRSKIYGPTVVLSNPVWTRMRKGTMRRTVKKPCWTPFLCMLILKRCNYRIIRLSPIFSVTIIMRTVPFTV